MFRCENGAFFTFFVKDGNFPNAATAASTTGAIDTLR